MFCEPAACDIIAVKAVNIRLDKTMEPKGLCMLYVPIAIIIAFALASAKTPHTT